MMEETEVGTYKDFWRLLKKLKSSKECNPTLVAVLMEYIFISQQDEIDRLRMEVGVY